jgi:hypothetical protein
VFGCEPVEGVDMGARAAVPIARYVCPELECAASQYVLPARRVRFTAAAFTPVVLQSSGSLDPASKAPGAPFKSE